MTLDIDTLINKEDISYEESIFRDPTIVSTWISYYNFKLNSDLFDTKLFILYRAVQTIPNSKELWSKLIELFLMEDSNIDGDCIIEIFEKCLVHHVKDKSIWIQYLQYLLDNQPLKITYIRRKFNECLQSLSIVDHKEIWPMYLQFANEIGGRTGVKIYLRYMEYLPPSSIKGELPGEMSLNDIIDKLREFDDIEESRKLYAKIIANPNEYSHLSKSNLQNLFEYIDLLMYNPVPRDDVFEKIIEDSIMAYPDQMGKLYIKAIEFFKLGNDVNIEKIRYYFHQGILKCTTLQDFVLLYDKYLEFEEDQLIQLTQSNVDSNIVPKYMDEFEQLINDRKLLINDTLLRENINNLDVWFIRFDFFKDDLNKLIQTLTEAIRSINPLKVKSVNNHKLNEIWMKYIDIYTNNNDFKTADLIYSKAVLSQYKHADELVELYINWCEFLLGCNEFPENKPIEILQDVLEDKKYDENNKTVQNKIIKSKKLREFYDDLVESFNM